MTTRPSIYDKPWWTAQVVAAMAFVLFAPWLIVRALPEPEQTMSVSLEPEAAEVYFAYEASPDLLVWVAVVGAVFAAVGALSWWVGRHSMRGERWRPGLGRLRDSLLALTTLAALAFVFASESRSSAEGSLVGASCPGADCELPLLFSLPDMAGLLWPWIVFVPMALGLAVRVVRPPPVAADPPVAIGYQVAILIVAGLLPVLAAVLYLV
jgi:hypothetical protein